MLRGRVGFPMASGAFGLYGSVSGNTAFGIGGLLTTNLVSPGFNSGHQVRFQAHADRAYFREATKDVPRTPDGSNPYEIFDVTPTEHTTLEEMAKTFKRLAVKNHPDRDGGSHDKMAEINAAFGIIKKNHLNVVRKIGEHRNRGPPGGEKTGSKNKHFRGGVKTKKQIFEENLGRSGGIRQNIRTMNSKNAKTAAEIQTAWELFREDREQAAEKIGGRFEFACEQASYYKKFATTKEIIYREKWLRAQFIRGVWEDVHELRAELLKKGHRNNTQMSELAEEMVKFSKDLEDRLTDELQQQSEHTISRGMRGHYFKVIRIIMIFIGLLNAGLLLSVTIFSNQWMVQFKEAIRGA